MKAKGSIHLGPCIFFTFERSEFTRSWSWMGQYRVQKITVNNNLLFKICFINCYVHDHKNCIGYYLSRSIFLLRLKGLNLRRVGPGRGKKSQNGCRD